MFFYFKVTLMAHLLGEKNHEPIFVALDFWYFLYTLCNHWHELERQIGQELCSLDINRVELEEGMDPVSSNIDHQSWLLAKRFCLFRWGDIRKKLIKCTSCAEFVARSNFLRPTNWNFTNNRYVVRVNWREENKWQAYSMFNNY